MDVPKSRCAGRLALLALTLFATGAFPAGADQMTVHDPDDSPSVIDVARVVQGHYAGNALYRVDAHEKWDSAALDNGRIVFAFNIDNDADVERRVILEYKGGGGAQLRSRIVNIHGRWIGRPVLRRPSSRSVEVWVPRWQLKHAMRYRVSLTVTTRPPGDCADGCKDRAPDRGTIFHRLLRLCSGEEPTLIGAGHYDRLRGTGEEVEDRPVRLAVLCGGSYLELERVAVNPGCTFAGGLRLHEDVQSHAPWGPDGCRQEAPPSDSTARLAVPSVARWRR